MAFIILDRDGVINYDSDEYIKSPAEWQAIPGSMEAIAKLNQAGFKVLIVTNQSGVARGYYDLPTLHAIHAKLELELSNVGGKIEAIFFCPHHPDEACKCRKPNIGLLEQIQQQYTVPFADTFFIGDSYTDIQVAQAVGCKPLLVLTGKGEHTLIKYPEIAVIPTFADLAAAVAFVLTQSRADHE